MRRPFLLSLALFLAAAVTSALAPTAYAESVNTRTDWALEAPAGADIYLVGLHVDSDYQACEVDRVVVFSERSSKSKPWKVTAKDTTKYTPVAALGLPPEAPRFWTLVVKKKTLSNGVVCKPVVMRGSASGPTRGGDSPWAAKAAPRVAAVNPLGVVFLASSSLSNESVHGGKLDTTKQCRSKRSILVQVETFPDVWMTIARDVSDSRGLWATAQANIDPVRWVLEEKTLTDDTVCASDVVLNE